VCNVYRQISTSVLCGRCLCALLLGTNLLDCRPPPLSTLFLPFLLLYLNSQCRVCSLLTAAYACLSTRLPLSSALLLPISRQISRTGLARHLRLRNIVLAQSLATQSQTSPLVIARAFSESHSGYLPQHLSIVYIDTQSRVYSAPLRYSHRRPGC
jgi:hypothetical protein